MRSEDTRDANVDFIELDLIPEMVHNRCFCEVGSREFVELESVTASRANVTHTRLKSHKSYAVLYEVTAVVRFSGEPQRFSLLVKLETEDERMKGRCFEAFQNEEMFYSKMTRCYGLDSFPKCYAADLGSYGRPVIALENLHADGYVPVDGQMDECHVIFCLRKLARFHGRGLRMRVEKSDVFREFYAKLLDVSFDDASLERYSRMPDRASNVLKLLPDPKLAEKIKEWLGGNPLQTAKRLATEIDDVSTICHGHFSRDNALFKHENEKPIDVRMIDWQTMRFCSPAIDLGPVLFANSSLLAKVRELLALYIDAVKLECPTISCVQLRKNLISNLPYAYVILSMEEDITDNELVNILLALNDLEAFD